MLIEVSAAGVSFPDLLLTRGRYQMKPELPFVPGAEIAGVVVESARGSRWKPGDRVAAVPGLGGFAQYAVVNEELVLRIPDGLALETAAGMPVNYLTAYFSLVHRAQLAAGESVLVHGAAGGLGSASIQVARAFGAGRVVAVVSSPEKGEVTIRAGAHEFVLVEGFASHARNLGGVDIVVDPVGGDRFTDSLRALRDDGRLLVVGFTAGEIPTVKVNRLLLNNVSVVGAGHGAYTSRRAGYEQAEWDALLPHIKSGLLNLPQFTTFPLEKAADALREMDERRVLGKVILTL
ncbi:NADPH:quinone oxidoreductase family protein [Dactylosporangium sp. NPDC051484]|uniref:NADPH:quinone oxidoreductase family protein n=1 Tax=Dactylosporangium sp. NPDC051484 TaxID=3154942 RepID=UPI0034510160